MKLKMYLKYALIMSLAILASCGDDDETTAPEIGEANVRLSEVDVESNEIVLKNFGDAAIDISGFWICNLKSYAQVNTLTTDDLTLDPNETITLDRQLNETASDVSLYLNNAGFGNSENIVDFMQYGADVGTAGRVDVAVAKGIWTAGEFVAGNIEFDYEGDGTDNGASFWASAGSSGEANVRFASIDPSNDQVTLKNFGDAAADISSYQFCRRKNYDAIGTLSTEDLTLDPNEEITIALTIDDNSSDVALYIDDSGFADADNLVDFMQFGDDIGDDGRANVAIVKGIWSEGEYVNGVGPYTYTGTGVENGLGNWDVSASGEAVIRLSQVDPALDMVVVKNFGTASKNISNYWFCARFDYNDVATLKTGNLILAPNEEISIPVTLDDASSDLGFYSTNTFGSSDALTDFMQYGDSGIGRESVADDKGVWTPGDFVNGVGPYTYTGTGDENGLDNWDVAEDGEAVIRLFEVDPASDIVVLKNFGTASKNISTYWFCVRFNYEEVATLQTGNLVLAPNEEISITVTLDDTSSDVSFYSTDTFGSADAMSDFMQYGEGGIGRESVANTKGIWTSGDFLDNPGPFSYTGDGNTNGVSVWE